MEWQTKGSRVVYDNPWIEVREDAVVRPDGGDGIYGVVRLKRPAVFVVALTDADEVVMVELYRYTTNKQSLEIVAGGTDGEDPLVAAQRELREEAGLAAAEWTHLGTHDILNGVCDAQEIVYLARGLTVVDGEEQADEGITAVHRIGWAETMAMVRDGRITDGETVAALLYAALALGRL